LTCAFRTAAATVFRGRVDGTSVDCFRPFGSSLSTVRGREEILLLYINTHTRTYRIGRGDVSGAGYEIGRERVSGNARNCSVISEGRGRSCARGDRHEIRRKEVIIKTRWDRARGQSISSRTDARTFSFNPTGHHLSENFSIRFKERSECAC